MINLNIHSLIEKDNCYIVSRNNKAYDFFKHEYNNLPIINDSIIVPKESEKKKETKLKSVFIPQGTKTHTYFKTEYGSMYTDVKDYGYYIPSEEPKRIR